MATNRGFAGWRAFGHESTFDTADTVDVTENYIGGDPLTLATDLVDDADQVNSLEEITDLEEMGRDVGGVHEQRATPNGLAWWLAYCLGNISTAGSNPYTHSITPFPKTFTSVAHGLGTETTLTVDDTASFPSAGTLVLIDDTEVTYTGKTATTFTGCSQPHSALADNEAVRLIANQVPMTLPSMTVLEEVGDPTNQRQYAGVVVSDTVVSISKKQFMTIAATLLGSGTMTWETAVSRPSILSESFLKASSGTLHYNGSWDGRTFTTGGTTIDANVIDFVWNLNNNMEGDEGYLFNGGLVRGRAENVRRSQSVTMNIEFTGAAPDYQAAQLAGTQFAFRLYVTGTGSFSFEVVFPVLQILSSNISGGTDVMSQTLECKVLEDPTWGSVEATVVNSVTGYLS